LANFDPGTELRLIWQLDDAQIIKRWELHQKFDPLNRLFGGEEKKNKIKKVKINPSSLEAQLLRLFPEG